MRKKRFTKFQLLVLLGAIFLVIWSRSESGPGFTGVVVFDRLETGRLYRSGLQLDTATDIAIREAVSFESDESEAPQATYGWIKRRSERGPVWAPDVRRTQMDDLIEIVADTIHLEAGTYDVFYTTEGPTSESEENAPFLGLTPYWTNRVGDLFFVISDISSVDDARRSMREIDLGTSRPGTSNLLWDTGFSGDWESFEQLLDVRSQTSVHIYAVGELCSRMCDSGSIVNAQSGETVWEMTWENTTPAGGTDRNRQFVGSVSLDEGLYRAVYQSNSKHSFENWTANPPFDPDAWGMQISSDGSGSIQKFSVDESGRQLVAMRRIGNDALRKKQIVVNEALNVFLDVMGEISTSGTLYDYAWLEQNDTREKIWEMSLEDSRPAGGSNTNREEDAVVQLSAGTYTLYYQTDDSHSYDSWEKPKPTHPERWGVALYTLGDTEGPISAITVLSGDERENQVRQGSASSPAEISVANSREELLVDLSGVGNEADLSSDLILSTATRLRIVAQGEISNQGRYDYGWIERTETGERVWEMTLSNTGSAGGEDRNRRFDGSVSLPAGEYVVRFVSDFSHAFGDFDDGPPTIENEWGIRIFGPSQ